MTTIELNTISTIIDAKLSARSFPGLRVEPSADDADSFDIVHSSDPTYNRLAVPLHALVVEVSNVILEFETRYGRGGEKLFDLSLHVGIVEPMSK